MPLTLNDNFELQKIDELLIKTAVKFLSKLVFLRLLEILSRIPILLLVKILSKIPLLLVQDTKDGYSRALKTWIQVYQNAFHVNVNSQVLKDIKSI